MLTSAALGERVTAVPRFPLEDVPMNAPWEVVAASNRLAGAVPFYLQDWFAAVVLVAWGVLPAVLGFAYFQRADLG